MATTIAISGKGGSGKTTVAAMIIKCLLERSGGSILAVDADPNSCLGLAMGLEPGPTVARLREDALKQPAGAGDRVRSFEYGIQQAVMEANGFDLLTMGRPEGPHCYCAVNNMLRTFLDKLSDAYDYVVTDNEAGMEHLSRRTTNNVDWLVIVAEPTPLGIVTAKRIFSLAKSLPISVKQTGLIWNNTRVDVVGDDIDKFEIPCFGSVPYDESVLEASMNGRGIFELKPDSAALSAIRDILKQRLSINWKNS